MHMDEQKLPLVIIVLVGMTSSVETNLNKDMTSLSQMPTLKMSRQNVRMLRKAATSAREKERLNWKKRLRRRHM